MLLKCIVIIIAIASVILMIPQYAAFVSEKNEEKTGFKEAIVKYKRFIVVAAIGCIGFAVYSCLLHYESWMGAVLVVHNQLLWNICFLIAAIDFKVKKIPNRTVIAILLVHTAYLIVRVCANPGQWKEAVFPSLIGLLAGTLFMAVCFAVSRGGVGGGDLKLYSSLGYCYGLVGIVAILLYSLLPAIIVGVALMVMKKAKFKTMMPMAPFILLGLTLYLVLR
ncbi:MAG: prepilin peptidase [Lachnospiraceae bacterium]|nr:prepilin peptidase [Lachnospiraceae bacterium]